MTTATKVLSGFVLGITVGTVLGVLCAPKKGYKTRRLIAKKATGIKDAAEKTYHRAKEILGVEKKIGAADMTNKS